MHKPVRQFARAIGGLIPTLFKDLDRMIEPSFKESKSWWDYFQREIPIARWGMSSKYNILGEEIQRPSYPWSWMISTQPDDEVWSALAAKASKGVFVPMVAASATVQEDGKRRKMNAEEFKAYTIRTGELYREHLEKNLERFRNLTPEQAKRVFDKER